MISNSLHNVYKLFDLNSESVMIILKISDNCYVFSQSYLVCGNSNIKLVDLWHSRLDYLNYCDLIKVANKKVVKGIQKLGKLSNPICHACQKGKLTRSTHGS